MQPPDAWAPAPACAPPEQCGRCTMAAHGPFLRAPDPCQHFCFRWRSINHAAKPPAAALGHRRPGRGQRQADAPHTRGLPPGVRGAAQWPPAGGGRKGECSGRVGAGEGCHHVHRQPRGPIAAGAAQLRRGGGCGLARQLATSHCAAGAPQAPPPAPTRRQQHACSMQAQYARRGAWSGGGAAAARAANACWCLCVHERAAARRLADHPASRPFPPPAVQVVGIDLGESRGTFVGLVGLCFLSCRASRPAHSRAAAPLSAVSCQPHPLQAPPTAQWQRWRAASPPSSPTQRAAAPPPRWWPSPRPATASWARCAAPACTAPSSAPLLAAFCSGSTQSGPSAHRQRPEAGWEAAQPGHSR